MRKSAVLVAAAAATALTSAWMTVPAGAATTFSVSCTAGQPNNLQSTLNTAPSGSTIHISGTCTGNFTVPANKALTLAGTATLDGDGSGTVLTINGGDNVRVSSLTFRHGDPGIKALDGATVTLSGSTVSGNTDGAFGGVAGIDNSGTMTLNSSTVSGNTATGDSSTGGINNSGMMTLNSSRVSGNT
ncbi:MAG: hypothetical protein JO155_01960, partial [Acidimicrobiia bacterium]|nr:hypothetical protein [Acidimicrobiia bacterium]